MSRRQQEAEEASRAAITWNQIFSFKLAYRQHRLDVADHLLCALEELRKVGSAEALAGNIFGPRAQ